MTSGDGACMAESMVPLCEYTELIASTVALSIVGWRVGPSAPLQPIHSHQWEQESASSESTLPPTVVCCGAGGQVFVQQRPDEAGAVPVAQRQRNQQLLWVIGGKPRKADEETGESSSSVQKCNTGCALSVFSAERGQLLI